MGTRIKKNPKQIFEVFCEIAIPTDSNKEPWITWKYPHSYKQQEILKSLPGFAYPCEFSNNAVQHFSFVLTNMDSQWTFGFCRHTADSSICYVMLSFLPWHEVFYKILNHIAELTNKEEAAKCHSLSLFLENLHNAEIPDPGLELHVLSSKNENFKAICPEKGKLPSIPENRNMTEYFNAVDAQNMMTIFASMLHERRILISSKKLSRLSACVQAANSLIYPMHWQHIFIPVLPKHLSDYLSAPMPFLIGIPAATLARMKIADTGDIVYLDADENRIESPFADLDALPSEVLQSLRHDLRHPQEMLGDAVARAFLKALVKLIGGYWSALRLRPTEKIIFNPEMFVQSRPSAMQPFLQKMLELQIFQQFIDCRVKKLNTGQGVHDEFEFELAAYEDKASFRLRNQYRDWVSNMKKEGGAFFKNVKTKVKDTSKKAYKDIRSKIHEINNHTMIEEDVPPPVPLRTDSDLMSQNGVSKETVQRNKRLIKHIKAQMKSKGDRTIITSVPRRVLAPTTPLRRPDSESPQLTFPPVDVDLMGDLHDVIFKRCSMCSCSSTDSQLIDLSLTDKPPCGPNCTSRRNSSSCDATPSRPPNRDAIVRHSSDPRPLIELDTEISPNSNNNGAALLDDIFTETNGNDAPLAHFGTQNGTNPPYRSPNLPYGAPNVPYGAPNTPFGAPGTPYGAPNTQCGAPNVPYGALSALNLNNSNGNAVSEAVNFRSTNPFCKSYSGPNVRNMVSMFQSPTFAITTSTTTSVFTKNETTMSTLSDGTKTNVSRTTSQILSRRTSTPISDRNTASMLLLQNSSKVSSNPFVMADGKNGNCVGNNGTFSSNWEDFS